MIDLNTTLALSPKNKTMKAACVGVALYNIIKPCPHRRDGYAVRWPGCLCNLLPGFCYFTRYLLHLFMLYTMQTPHSHQTSMFLLAVSQLVPTHNRPPQVQGDTCLQRVMDTLLRLSLHDHNGTLSCISSPDGARKRRVFGKSCILCLQYQRA